MHLPLSTSRKYISRGFSNLLKTPSMLILMFSPFITLQNQQFPFFTLILCVYSFLLHPFVASVAFIFFPILAFCFYQVR